MTERTWRKGDPLSTRPLVCAIEGCGQKVFGRGYCRRHYVRWYDHGDALWEPSKPTTEQKYRALVTVAGPEECWPWQGGTSSDGSGRFLDTDGREVRAQRFGWELVNGPIPQNMKTVSTCATGKLCQNMIHWKLVPSKELANGNHALIDLTGQIFGELVVLRRSDRRSNNGALWWCRCTACGREVEVRGSSMRSAVKPSLSCGCRAAGGYKHGGSSLAEYTTWQDMKGRCLNPAGTEYHNYGGRGIVVCDRWRDSFPNFLADMGLKPSPKHSIERIDVNGNYEPSNCCWATSMEQARNKRNTRLLTHEGRTQTVSEWAREVGIKPGALWQRVYTLGWTIERALTTPVRPKVR